MNGLFGRWTRRGRGPEPVLSHWLDVTPIERSESPCCVSSLDVEVHVTGLFAEVTQTMAIHNPNGRPQSAALAVPMPDRAVVCGYGLDIDGQMVDGVVVERERARVAFETEQRRGADPGLVEAVRGNVYRTRVYPVPARGERHVRLSYVAPLLMARDGSTTLDLPMPPERLARRSVNIDVDMLDAPAPVVSGLGGLRMTEARGVWRIQVEERDVEPRESVRVALPELPASFALLERDAEGTTWFCASAMEAEVAKEDMAPIRALTVLWDVSGSRAGADHERELELVRAYCAEPVVESLRLVTFADTVREVLEFVSGDELVAHIRTLRYDGGTNLVELARVVTDLASGGAASAFVLFSDGFDTLADEPFQLPRSCNVVAIVCEQERDIESLRQACGGLAYDIALAPKDANELAQALARSGASGLRAIGAEGLADVCDVSLVDGERRAIVGRLTGSEARINLGSGADPIVLRDADAREGSVLAHAWAAKRVSLLAPRAEECADELLSLGRRFGVASPVTSLIVLETLDQWLRHEIEPPVTWERMHAEWERAQKGRMRVTSEEERKASHRAALVRDWADLMRWWENDRWAAPKFMPGHRYCQHCGAELSDDVVFCVVCGGRLQPSPVPLRDDGIFLSSQASEHRLSPTDELMPSDAFELEAAAPPAAFDAEEAVSPRRRASGLFSRGVQSRRDNAGPSRSLAGIPLVGAAPIVDAIPLAAGSAMRDAASSNDSSQHPDSTARVQVRAWMPNAPYLKALDKALKDGPEAAHEVYHKQRDAWRTSPAFFLDCAGWFIEHRDEEFGVSVLTNLAELRIEDAALLRVMAWRLREAGRLEQALVVLRRVLRLRGEDAQSHRDVALVLDEMAREAFARGDEDAARAYAEEAAALYRKLALTPWGRRAMALGLFAVEEHNVLRAWADVQTWRVAPDIPSLGDGLEGVPACDLRITMAWDADETDVDIHVTEPSGEEAYYGHRFTSSGGRVSEDITDGYGPEQYSIRKAREGNYLIRAHYYASHQQTVFGPATCTLTVYTDWGKPTQTRQVTTTRLEKEREMVVVGTASYGKAPAKAPESVVDRRQQVRPGMTFAQVKDILGEPEVRLVADVETWCWDLPAGRSLKVTFANGKVTHLAELMPWGEEMLIN